MSSLLKKEKILITCTLLLFLIVAFYDVFFLGKTFKATTANAQALPTGVYGQTDNKPSFIPVNGTDSPVLEEPIYEFIKKNLRQGILPLWNPHQACGYPLIAMIQVGIFFPLNFVMYIFPEIYAWDILILVRLLLAGLFTYWFMRTSGFKKIPSLVSGLIFMLSGPMLLLQYWTANVDILTPVLLIAADRLIRRTQSRNLVFLSLAIALTVFAGHPEHIFLVNVYCVAFFSFRLFTLRKTTDCKKSLLYFVLAYFLGISLSAIVLFPFLRNLVSEFWNGHPPGTGLLMEEQRHKALSLALPYFFQSVPLTYQWVFAGWWGGYLGTLPIGLAFLSLFNKHKKGLNYFFAASAFILIGKQYGLPIINWIGYLPLFSICRYAIHTPTITAFTIAVLAGMGLRSILLNKNMFRKALLYSLSLLLIVSIHLIVLRESSTLKISLKASLLALVFLIIFQIILFLKDRNVFKNKQVIAILILFAVFAELFSYIHRERPHRFDSFGKVPYIKFLKSDPERMRSYGIYWAFYPNTATGFGLDDLGYFFGLVPKRFVHFTNALLIKNHFQKDLRPPTLRAVPILRRDPFLDLLNIKYIIAPSDDWTSKYQPDFYNFSKKLDPVYSHEVNIYERENVFPRAYVVHRAFFQPDDQESLKLIARIGSQLRQVAVINHPAIPAILTQLKKTPAEDKSIASIRKHTPNEVLIDADLEHAGFLVLSDAFHPDWKAFVNGKDWKIFQTNYLLRSLFLPKGHYQIRLVFQPVSFYIGSFISLLSLIVMLILFIPFSFKIPTKTRAI